MRVLVAGASGMIGSELRAQLDRAGHDVLRLVRREPEAEGEHRWDPEGAGAGPSLVALMERADAVVNLAGAPLDRLPWTGAAKRRILSSRLRATGTVVEAMRAASAPPATLVNGSAVGYYGDRPGVELTEEAPKGTGFLSDVVEAWEAAAALAPDGTRVVTVRTGLVIGRGGAMRPLLPAARLGLGGPIAGGRQHWPWVSLHDEAAAIVHLLGSGLAGPVNVAGPVPATEAEVVRALADALHRPYGLPLPRPAVTLGLGEAGRELLLADQRVIPRRLIDDGFVFRDRTVREAMERLVGPGAA